MGIVRFWNSLTQYHVAHLDGQAASVPEWDPEAEQRKEQLQAIYEALGDVAIPDYVPEVWAE